MKNLLIIITILLVIFANSVYSQNDPPKKSKYSYMHKEVPDDKYVPYPPKEEIKTSPAYTIMKSNFFSTQVNIDANGYNIIGDAANEPSIGIDPSNPNRMVIGWRQFNSITSNFRQAGYGYSTNGGNSWVFPGLIESGVFRSDPIIDCSIDGTFYYNSLSSDNGDYFCKVFKTTGSGINWNEGVDAQGGDKQWMVIDQTNGMGSGNIYSNWNYYYSHCFPYDFTRSINHGTSFENCGAIQEQTHWGTLAVGPEGDLYTVGANDNNEIIVNISTSAMDTLFPVMWNFPSEVNLDGELSGWTDPNPSGILGQAYIDVDHSAGPSHGYVYVVATIDRNSNADPGDIMFSKSTNGGSTWLSTPVRINDDVSTSNTQWFGTMSVAPNGRIDVVWLDTRNSPAGPVQSALYYSFSTNQGNTWSVNEQLSNYFDSHVGWPNQEKMGDYFDMLSDNNGAHLAWCGTFNGEEDVYYGRITPVVGINEIANNHQTLYLSNYPNPFTDHTTITYILPEKCNVKLVIYDIYGKEIKTLVNKSEDAGFHKIILEASELPGGIYYYNINAGTTIESKSLVIIK